jgi:biopolymer transport protein ExbD
LRHRLPPGINLTPMLGVIFGLIFFFILAANVPVDSARMEVRLPRARSGETAAQADLIPAITIGADGRLIFKGRTMVEEELRLELNALARRGARRVRVQADERTRHGRVVQVMEFCRTAGIDDVLWDVRPTSPPPLP